MAGIIAAQGMVREVCVGSGLPAGVVNDAALVAGVLVTDSMGQTQGGGPWLQVELGAHAVTLRVEDTSTALPVHGSEGRVAGGYDLDILGRLVDTWGFSRTSTGRQVWALLTDSMMATERTGAVAGTRQLPGAARWDADKPVAAGRSFPAGRRRPRAAAEVPAENLVGLCDSVMGHMLVAGATLAGMAAPPHNRTRLFHAGAAMDAAMRELRECADLLPYIEPAAAAPRAGREPAPPTAIGRRASLVADPWRC